MLTENALVFSVRCLSGGMDGLLCVVRIFVVSIQSPTAWMKTSSVLMICGDIPRYEAARRILFHDHRTFFPCNICDHIPMREGLLPDHLGKQKMEKPTKED